MSRGVMIALAIAVFGVIIGLAVPILGVWWLLRPLPPKEPLTMRLDTAGPYMILASRRSAESYAKAIEKAKMLHPAAELLEFDPDKLDETLPALQKTQPRYALIFVLPDEMDVNFAWRWLTLASQVDDDPFVDVRTGFICGRTPEAAEVFADRIAEAAAGRIQLPGALVDNLGPAEQGTRKFFTTSKSAMMLPAEMNRRFTTRSIFHGQGSFTDDRLATMDNAGLIHFGGHGHPNQVDGGLTAPQVPRLKLAPSVIFNGACYTGVTGRWFDETKGACSEEQVAADDSFCLRLLENDALAYLAAVHPDHGIPVYQEMEFLAFTGSPLGEVMRHTHNGVVMGAGGKLPDLKPLSGGTPAVARAPADVMLKGTAARLLFGDPALIACEAFLEPPFVVKTTAKDNELNVTATLTNAGLKSTFTDTYQNDLNSKAPFNDRALIVVELPSGWTSIDAVENVSVKARGKTIPHRLVGFAVERDSGDVRLHVQIDVPAQGFQQSALRVAGATVEFTVRRKAAAP